MNPAYQRGQLLFQQRRYDLAADALREALGANPNDAHAHAMLALCLAKQEKFDDATQAAQNAIVHEPALAFAHYALASVYLDRNRFPEAQTAAAEAVRLAPSDTENWTLLGFAQFFQGRWADALNSADHGLHFDAQHTGAINLRAMALVKLGRKDEAAHSIAGALQRNPDNAHSHANQGWTCLHQNDHKQALEHFREALRLDPNSEWARQGMTAALKARYLPYRVMLRYFLWMSRFRQRGQWFLILGLWFGYQMLRGIMKSAPELTPFLIPLVVAYVLFVWSTWVADPIFNFTLLLNKFGRYLLSRQQIIGAILVVIGGTAALALAAVYLASQEELFLLLAILSAALTLSIAATARSRERSTLTLMIAYTALAALATVGGILLAPQNADLGIALFQGGLIALFLSSIVANLLASRTIRR